MEYQSLLMYHTVLHMPRWFPGARFKPRARHTIGHPLQAASDKVKAELVSFSMRLMYRVLEFELPTGCMIHHTHIRLPESPLHRLLRI